jgi:glycosyltransferase involved in cell wall biosynthesis
MTTDRPLSVAHVLWSGGVGGIERLVHQLALHQRSSGLTVSVVFGQARGPFAAAIRDAGLPVRDLGLRSGFDLRPWHVRSAARALAGSDVIHLHGFNLPFGAIAMASKRPIVFTDHGIVSIGPRTGVAGHILRIAKRGFLRRACAKIAANSMWTRARLGEVLGVDPGLVTVIHNGIATTSPTDPARRATGDARLVVAFVGRLAAIKRVDRLLRGLSQVHEPARVRGLIVGDGPLENDLKELASSLGCNSLVEFLGYSSDVDSILSASDVLVQPGQEEAFGLTIIEGCRQGALPVVFADGGGALEVLPPDGRVVADESDLAQVLDTLVHDRQALTPSARRSRAAWAVERFPIHRTADAYLALYRASVARCRP